MDAYLLTFIAVVEQRSFTKAAEQLHMTQPAVSQTIRNLEKQLGTVLIERKHKVFHLNKAGEIVYAYAKETASRYEEMQSLVSEVKNAPTGTLSIGASYTIGEYIIPPVFRPMQQQYPLIQPDVVIGNTEFIVDLLLHRQIDIGLIEGDIDHASIESEPFMTDDMYIYSGDGTSFKGERTVGLETLNESPWIIREKGSGTRHMTEQFFKRNALQPEHLFTFGSTQIIKGAVESGLGISLLSRWAVQHEISLGLIHPLNTVVTPIKRQFYIINMKEEFRRKSVQVFKELIIERYKGY